MKLIKLASDLIKKFKNQSKDIKKRSKRDQISSNLIKNDQKRQKSIKFQTDFDFFNLLIDIKVIF